MNKIFLVMLWGGLINFCYAMQVYEPAVESEENIISISFDELEEIDLYEQSEKSNELEEIDELNFLDDPFLDLEIKQPLEFDVINSVQAARKWFGTTRKGIPFSKKLLNKKLSNFFEKYKELIYIKILSEDDRIFFYSYFIQMRLPVYLRRIKEDLKLKDSFVEEIYLILEKFFNSMSHYYRHLIIRMFEYDLEFRTFIVNFIMNFYKMSEEEKIVCLFTNDTFNVFFHKNSNISVNFNYEDIFCDKYIFFIKTKKDLPKDFKNIMLFLFKFLTVSNSKLISKNFVENEIEITSEFYIKKR